LLIIQPDSLEEAGDIFVKIIVKIPKKITQRQKELLEEFAKGKGSVKSKKGKHFWDKIKK